MNDAHHHPDGLREIAARLREDRPQLDPLALDRVKLQVLSRARRGGSLSVRPRLASPLMAVLTVLLVAIGSGTALALCGGGGFEPPPEEENAGWWQYRSGCPSGYEETGQKECCPTKQDSYSGTYSGTYSGSYSYDKSGDYKSGGCEDGGKESWGSGGW